MSGHSKWHSIKHKKGAADAKRGQMFTKIIKEISVAAKMGGGDQEANARLRAAILKAKGANMPKDNIDRAIKKGTGELEGVNYEELTYEAYAPGGVALLIDILTDNKNRTAAEVRNVLSKAGGSLGTAGSVARLFKRKGMIGYDAAKYKEDDIINVALEAGAQDVTTEDGTIEVECEPDQFEAVLDALTKAGFEHLAAEVNMVPESEVKLDDDKTQKVMRLIETLEESDDVQNVSTNLEMPDE